MATCPEMSHSRLFAVELFDVVDPVAGRRCADSGKATPRIAMIAERWSFNLVDLQA